MIVSPAGAGMHRTWRSATLRPPSFPRRRGDAPRDSVAATGEPSFPPQARGCTLFAVEEGGEDEVSPAGAGMHPAPEPTNHGRNGFPRRRGDAPRSTTVVRHRYRFPPQARGCTLYRPARRSLELVSPAGAGMHPSPAASGIPPGGFPRRRGDAPRATLSPAALRRFPPQARGCTDSERRLDRGLVVSPAGAGMHRIASSRIVMSICFPRRRGDAPTGRKP